MAKIIIFAILATIIIASAVMCVATKKIMRAATFLLFVLFGVAGIYFLLGYTFLGAAQVAVYAGGITMLYVFAIQLVSKRTLQGLEERVKIKDIIFGALAACVGFATVAVIVLKNKVLYTSLNCCKVLPTDSDELPMSTIGTALLGSERYQYVLPFELISIFLLACIIGGIMIARKEETEK